MQQSINLFTIWGNMNPLLCLEDYFPDMTGISVTFNDTFNILDSEE